MEERDVPSLAATHGCICIYPKVHISIDCHVVMPDFEPSR